LGKLGYAVYENGNLFAKSLLDFIHGDIGILHRVMQQTGNDRGAVEALVAKNPGDFNRVRKVGIATGPFLGAMRFHGEDIGPVERVFIRTRLVGPNPFHQFELAHHGERYSSLVSARSWR